MDYWKALHKLCGKRFLCQVLQLLLLLAQAAEEDQLAVVAVMMSLVQMHDDHVVFALCQGVIDLLSELVRSSFKAVEVQSQHRPHYEQ